MTAAVLAWPRHFMHGPWCHGEEHESESCQACVLSLCLVCGGAEGDLTADCPGRRTTEGERAAVARGDLDYKAGAWLRRAADG